MLVASAAAAACACAAVEADCEGRRRAANASSCCCCCCSSSGMDGSREPLRRSRAALTRTRSELAAGPATVAAPKVGEAGAVFTLLLLLRVPPLVWQQLALLWLLFVPRRACGGGPRAVARLGHCDGRGRTGWRRLGVIVVIAQHNGDGDGRPRGGRGLGAVIEIA